MSAGLLNILSGTTIFIMLVAPELNPIPFVGPFVIFDMIVAAMFSRCRTDRHLMPVPGGS